MPARRHDVSPSQVERESRKAETGDAHEHPHPHEPEPEVRRTALQDTPPSGPVNPPDAETEPQDVDNRTREGRQVPVNPPED